MVLKKPISNSLGRDVRLSNPPHPPRHLSPSGHIKVSRIMWYNRYATVVVFWVSWLLDACCWRRLWWGGELTRIGDCYLVWRGPPAGWLSDVGLVADVVCCLPVAGGEDDEDRVRGTLYCSALAFTMQHRRGHFQTSIEIRIVANELPTFKNRI